MSHNNAQAVIRILIFAMTLFCMPLLSSAAKDAAYVFAVLPSAPPVETYALWTPFVERIARDTGMDLHLKVYEKMAEFERDISVGGPDFIFASPLQAVVAHQAQGYLPLVRGNKLVAAEIFVRKDSPIKTVGDLAGRKIAFAGSKSL